MVSWLNASSLDFGVALLNIKDNVAENILMLFLYTLGMVLYAVLIWHFYRILGKRDIFEGDLSQYKLLHHGFFSKIWDFFEFLFRYIVIFPVISFIFFAVLSSLILFLSKNQGVQQIMLMSMSIVASARIASYYSEDLSKDLAKMIPFALLGVFIVDPSFFSIELAMDKIHEVPSLLSLIIQYLLFTVALEFFLRVLFNIYKSFTKQD